MLPQTMQHALYILYTKEFNELCHCIPIFDVNLVPKTDSTILKERQFIGRYIHDTYQRPWVLYIPSVDQQQVGSKGGGGGGVGT